MKTKNKIMKALLVFLILFSSCSNYVNFTSNEYAYLSESEKEINMLQFYNAKDFVIWKDNSLTNTNVTEKGILKQNTKSSTNATVFLKRNGIICDNSAFSSEILVGRPLKDSQNALQFQKLKDFPYEIREQFIEKILQNKKVNNDLYYLFPKRIEQCTVNSEVIYGKSGEFNKFIRAFKPKIYISITCCVVDWGGEEWKLYMKNATYLQIKRKESSKSRLKINEAKGNYVK